MCETDSGDGFGDTDSGLKGTCHKKFMDLFLAGFEI